MNSKKIMIGIILISLFLIPITPQLTSATNSKIGVGQSGGTITITTEEMTIKIVPNQAHIMWWLGNHSTADEMYKLQLLKIREFMGDDAILDDKTEFGGISYNLISNDWVVDVDEDETEVTITLSLLGLANGADIYLIMHVYNNDTPINGTDQVAEGLTELKFDIIVDNWSFSPMAKGIAIQTYVTEVQHRHRVQIRNGTLTENGNATRKMLFESNGWNAPIAYFEWAEFANVYNSTTEELVDTIDVGTAYFDDLASPPTEAPGFKEGLAHLFLTYPKYGDDLKMVHDPSIGINTDAATVGFSLFILPVIGGLFASAAVLFIVKRRK